MHGALGNPGSQVLSLPDGANAWVRLPGPALQNRSFSVECWVRRSGADLGQSQFVLGMGPMAIRTGLHFGYRTSNVFTMGFWGDDIDAAAPCTDNEWHHYCGTYDSASRTQRMYFDGQLVATRPTGGDFTGSGDLWVGSTSRKTTTSWAISPSFASGTAPAVKSRCAV